jgi:cytochrome c556
MNMHRLHRIGLFTALATVFAIAGVQAATEATSEAEAAKAIKARQALLNQINDLNEPMGRVLKRQIPMDPAVVATNAARIQELAARLPEAFAVDTRKFKGTRTAALDGIWSSEADFKARAEVLAKAAGDAVTAARGGTVAVAQLAGIGRACGNCHDAFKARD